MAEGVGPSGYVVGIQFATAIEDDESISFEETTTARFSSKEPSTMKRRDFLLGAAVSAASVVALGGQGRQTPAPEGRGAGQQGRGGGGRGRGPAPVEPAKLARISLMTLDFNSYLKNPKDPNPGPDQTLTLFDLPKMYVDNYGIHNIEYQHTTLVQSETDPAFIKELKAKLDENKVAMTQINLEFGTAQSISNPDVAGRQQAVEHVKQWMDIANQYGCPRVMINQQQPQLTKETREGAVAAMKAMADYGRAKNVKVSVETRGAGTPEYVQQIGGVKPWEFMLGIIKDAGANSNVDIGNVGAMNQQELHECIKAWFPYSSGNMHIKSSPFWDIGQTIRFTEALGYKGLYSIEVSRHEAVRIVYNTILANLG
jgi:sugar phosphate isomerase/epimerase